VSVDSSCINGLLARFPREAISRHTPEEVGAWSGKIAVAFDDTPVTCPAPDRLGQGSSRQRKRRLTAPGIPCFSATQFKSSTVPATTTAQPANITSGQRLRG
jgi:hypothetical protein